MLLELAVGDAYGAGFEFVDESIIKTENNLKTYLKHPRWKTGSGRYTDDTQMSIGLAELLIEGKDWIPINIANKFVEVFKRDPREAYAKKFFEFLKSVETGNEFLERIKPDSDRAGSSMRASPIGFLPNTNKVIIYSTVQAKLTHNTPLGIDSAVASALMSHYFIYRLGDKNKLGEFIEKYVPGNWNEPWHGKAGNKGYECVRAAITAIQEKDSLSSILKRCIDFTGDVDTIATIALGAASCAIDIKQDLPLNLIEGLENTPYGRDYLIQLDKKLRAKFLK